MKRQKRKECPGVEEEVEAEVEAEEEAEEGEEVVEEEEIEVVGGVAEVVSVLVAETVWEKRTGIEELRGKGQSALLQEGMQGVT